MHYYLSFENDGFIHLEELSDHGYKNRSQIDKDRNTYGSCRIFDSIDAAIKNLDGYTRTVILPDNGKIIPLYQNYGLL